MSDKFDELTKNLAQSVTRRGALKKFGVGLAGIALTSLGLANRAEAQSHCKSDSDCAGLACCKGKCVDLYSDYFNCGACGQRCPKGYYCMAGSCYEIH